MTFKDYLKNLNELAESQPSLLSCIIVASADEDGNEFYEIGYKPSVGNFKDDQFVQVSEFHDYEIDDNDTNAICIN